MEKLEAELIQIEQKFEVKLELFKTFLNAN